MRSAASVRGGGGRGYRCWWPAFDVERRRWRSDSANRQTVDVKITDAGCEPANLNLATGQTTFSVRNNGAANVTEFEILDGASILGEAENLAPGLSGAFSLTLKPGTYTTYCPGGDGSERGTLVVTGSRAAAASAAATRAVARVPPLRAAADGELVDRTTKFAAAVKAGDIPEAKRSTRRPGPPTSASSPWRRASVTSIPPSTPAKGTSTRRTGPGSTRSRRRCGRPDHSKAPQPLPISSFGM